MQHTYAIKAGMYAANLERMWLPKNTSTKSVYIIQIL